MLRKKYTTLYPTGRNNSSKIILNHTPNCIVKEMAGNISKIVPEYNMPPRDLNMAKNTGLAGE
jgi:hypothetical protein